MSIHRSLMLAITVIVYATCSPPAFGQPQVGDDISATDRLNLRSCPGTVNCSVLRILPPGTELRVAEKRNDWVRVTIVDTSEIGWVHAGYTRVLKKPAPGASMTVPGRELGRLSFLFVPVCFFCALLVAASFGKGNKPGATRGQLFVLSALSVLSGLAICLNQAGPAIAGLFAPWLNLGSLAFLWKGNNLIAGIDYGQVVLYLGATMVGVALISAKVSDGMSSYLQGVCTGFLALPALALALGLAWLVLLVVSFVFQAALFLLSFIMIPFVWVYEHLLLPLLRFLAIPFIWLWENFLREIVMFLATPFIWLWNVVLQPLFGLLYKYLFKPILYLILGTGAALLCLLPFGVIGLLMAESIRNSFRGPLDSDGLFAQGVTLGFLLLDAVLLTSLNLLGVLGSSPPLTLAIPVALTAVVFLRLLLARRRAGGETKPYFCKKLEIYWKSSGLELVSTCVLIPVGLCLALMADDNGG